LNPDSMLEGQACIQR